MGRMANPNGVKELLQIKRMSTNVPMTFPLRMLHVMPTSNANNDNHISNEKCESDKLLGALQMMYAQFGHPSQVHTDNATYFRSQLMQEAFKCAGIRLTLTPTYNPHSNSVEQVHRDLNVMLLVLCHQHAAD